MAVHLYFGLPGAGKTTMMVYQALKCKKSGRYKNIYCNVHIAVEGVTYIDNECIGKYNLADCAILIDEATLFADNRDYKNFDKGKITFFLEHRHYSADVFLYTQQWDGIDRKIRVITDRVYYVYKGKLLGKWFTRCYRIPYGIIIPDPKKDGSEKLGEIVQGYCKPNFLIRTFSPWLYRPRYYKYFDSWERPYLPPLPSRYKVYSEVGVTQGKAKPKPPKGIASAAVRLRTAVLSVRNRLYLPLKTTAPEAEQFRANGADLRSGEGQNMGATTTAPMCPLSIVQKTTKARKKNDGCQR